MLNPSNLPSAAGAAAGAAAGTIAGLDAGTALRKAVLRKPVHVARPGEPSSAPAWLLDVLRRKGLAAAGGAVMKAGARRAAVRGYAAATTAATAAGAPHATAAATSKAAAAAAPSSASLAFLSDPRLSIEEKLMRLMAYLNAKYEKEMQAKMDELAGKKPASSSGTKRSCGGIFGKALSAVVPKDVAEAVKGFLKFPGVKTFVGHVAGPVLAAGATVLGFPAAAPFLLKYGSNAVDLAGDAADAVSSASSSGSASGSSASGSSGASGTEGKTEQLQMMEIQRLVDKQKEMFSLVSNILKAGHDTRMAAINNVR